MNSQTIKGSTYRGTSEKTTGSTFCSAEVHYKKPVVYMVPYHEIREMTQEDWFFQIASLIASTVLGIIIEKAIDEVNLPIYLWIFGAFSLLLLLYHLYRFWRKEKKMQKLKETAIQIPIELPKAYTSGPK